jgi:hypothetical protein
MKDTAFRKKNRLDVHRKATTRSTVVWAIARRRPRQMPEDKIPPFDSLQSLASFTTSLFAFLVCIYCAWLCRRIVSFCVVLALVSDEVVSSVVEPSKGQTNSQNVLLVQRTKRHGLVRSEFRVFCRLEPSCHLPPKQHWNTMEI